MKLPYDQLSNFHLAHKKPPHNSYHESCKKNLYNYYISVYISHSCPCSLLPESEQGLSLACIKANTAARYFIGLFVSNCS